MITSKDNKLIKYCIQVKDKKASRKEKVCLVETYKIVREMLQRNLVIKIICIEPKFELFSNISSVQIEKITDSLADFLSDTKTTDGVFALCRIPETSDKLSDRILVLDNIQDPSNMGAIIRSACAFGYDTILSVNSVYPYSYKCIRSSMGHIFNVNFIETDYENLQKLKTKNNIKFVCADMRGENLDNFHYKAEKIAVIIGNEGQGVSKEIENLSDYIISIPMKNSVESLNASVSASIIMYYLKKWGIFYVRTQ